MVTDYIEVESGSLYDYLNKVVLSLEGTRKFRWPERRCMNLIALPIPQSIGGLLRHVL